VSPDERTACKCAASNRGYASPLGAGWQFAQALYSPPCSGRYIGCYACRRVVLSWRVHGSLSLLVLCQSIGKTIRHEVQRDVVFEERFCAGEHKRETLSCIKCMLYGLLLTFS
jgi:hypothetical protein